MGRLKDPVTSVVRSKLCWDANNAVEPRWDFQNNWKVGLDCYEFLCFESPSVLFASQHNLFRTI